MYEVTRQKRRCTKRKLKKKSSSLCLFSFFCIVGFLFNRYNSSFRVSPAETAPFSSSSAQLVTSCVACHWFNLPNFYKEVERLLVKNGVAAFYSYTLPSLVDHEKAEDLNEALSDVSILTVRKIISVLFCGRRQSPIISEKGREVGILLKTLCLHCVF